MLLLATTFFLTSVASAYANPKVNLGPTTLVGLSIPDSGVEFFGGIPFAEPPLGNLRLKPPVLKTRLSDHIFDATSFKSACLQPAADTTGLSEDCLTVNIYRPADIPIHAKLPVVFWTYGGGFTGGASSAYNASMLVARSVARGTPVIYVNHNYRLGPLGYPQGQEADDKKILNLALKDQLTALEWVQANIEVFGGDKSKVTVFGESAGAIMISTLMLNSPLPRLARAAILESGSAGTSIDLKASQRENVWQVFVSGVPSCASLATSGKTLDCLLKVNTSEIFAGVNYAVANAGPFPFNPTLDGPNGLVPDIPSRVYASGRFAKIPFITGTNLDEGTVFVDSSDLSENGIRNYFINRYSPPLITAAALNATVDQLLKLYPDVPTLGSPFNTGNETFGLPTGFKRESAIMGDTTFQAPRRRVTQTASRFGVPVYGYLFTQPQGYSGFPPFLGVAHTTEIAYVYGTTPDPSPLSNTIMDYWLSFATSLTPNDGRGSSRPVWPRYTPRDQILIDLNSANLTTIPDTYRKTQIDFINANPLIFHH